MQAQANDLAGTEGGELRFGVTPMAANLNTTDVLVKLRKSIPRLVLNVQVNFWEHLSHQLETDQLEFVVATLRADQQFDPRFSITHLPPQPASIFAAAITPWHGRHNRLRGRRFSITPGAASCRQTRLRCMPCST